MVKSVVRLYGTGTIAVLKLGKRSRREGKNRSLTEDQGRLLQQLICEKRLVRILPPFLRQ